MERLKGLLLDGLACLSLVGAVALNILIAVLKLAVPLAAIKYLLS